MMKINGIPLPPSMSLQDFFSKAKQGRMDYGNGLLASPYMNDPNNLDDRLDIFMNMLNYNPKNINGLDGGESNALDAINFATHGAEMANENSYVDDQVVKQTGLDALPVQADAYFAYHDHGLPLWLAIQKGLVK